MFSTYCSKWFRHLNKKSSPYQISFRPFSNIANHDKQGYDISSRLIVIPDANFAGNAHGGKLVHYMTQSAFAATIRYLNTLSNEKHSLFDTTLGTLAETNFLFPVHIGDVIEVRSRVELSSNSTIQVGVELFAENLYTGRKRLSNSTTAWFVALKPGCQNDLVVAKGIPQMEALSAEAELRYTQQKTTRQLQHFSESELLDRFQNGDWNASMAKIVDQQDVLRNNFASGEFVIKFMDETAYLSCVRHNCTMNCVTARIDRLQFVSPMKKGTLCSVKARPTFASNRSLEIELVVTGEDLARKTKRVVAYGFFVFVSLDGDGKALPMKPLKTVDAVAMARYQRNRESRMNTHR